VLRETSFFSSSSSTSPYPSDFLNSFFPRAELQESSFNSTVSSTIQFFQVPFPPRTKRNYRACFFVRSAPLNDCSPARCLAPTFPADRVWREFSFFPCLSFRELTSVVVRSDNDSWSSGRASGWSMSVLFASDLLAPRTRVSVRFPPFLIRYSVSEDCLPFIPAYLRLFCGSSRASV